MYSGPFFIVHTLFCFTLFFQWVKEKQTEFNVTPMQLLYYQAPMCCVFLLTMIPFFEPVLGPGGIIGGPWSIQALVITYAINQVFISNIN